MTTTTTPRGPTSSDFSHRYAAEHAPVLDRHIESGLWAAMGAVMDRITEVGGPLTWVNQSACGEPSRDLDVGYFFPPAGANLRLSDAAKLCVTCPVQAECAASATAMGVTHGIRAGQNASALPRRQAPAAPYAGA